MICLPVEHCTFIAAYYVEFDSSYFDEETKMEHYSSYRERKSKEMQRTIAQTRPRHGESVSIQ